MKVQKSFAAGEGKEGVLYLVATPIGNLEDLTLRAIRLLREADIIAAEDTRHTRKLLSHLDIPSAKLWSYHEHNKESSGRRLIGELLAGNSVALVSDAGTPAISDPGVELVQAAISEQIRVVPVPGANAALSALIVSGLPTDQFVFVGFLPRDNKGLRRRLEQLQSMPGTLLCYESPHRIVHTLKMMLETWGDRRIALARELTKKHEEICRGSISECLQHLAEHPPRGEYCIVVEGAGSGVHTKEHGASGQEDDWWAELDVSAHMEHYIRQGKEKKEAMKLVAKDRGVSRRDIYNQIVKA